MRTLRARITGTLRTVAIAAVLTVITGLLVLWRFRLQQQERTEDARVHHTRYCLDNLHAAVVQFKADTGRYPTGKEGLKALLDAPTDASGWDPGGYVEYADLPRDAWDRGFVYIREPSKDVPFVIVSYGADGKPGGEGYDADLKSTDAGL